MDLSQLTDQDLRAILLTCDGKGKEAKEAALRELIDRAIAQERQERDDFQAEWDGGSMV